MLGILVADLAGLFEQEAEIRARLGKLHTDRLLGADVRSGDEIRWSLLGDLELTYFAQVPQKATGGFASRPFHHVYDCRLDSQSVLFLSLSRVRRRSRPRC